MADASDAATIPKRRERPAPQRRTLLVMVDGTIEARRLPSVGTLTVGRAETCDVRVDHPSMSRKHLTLQLTESAASVTDHGGTNGVEMRGVKLPASTPVEVLPNEAFVAGDVTLVVQEVHAAPAVARTTTRKPSGRVDPTASPIVADPAMQRLYDVAARVAQGTIGVLVVGETGAGKEMLAEAVHRGSRVATGPLVRINCAALSESLVEAELFGHEKGAFTGADRERRGLLETAHGGTAFLDEIGELPLQTQAKLLRVLEDGQLLRVGATTPRAVEVRFVAATNRDLEAEIAAGRFRRDLYFRIAGVVLEVPPLRERPIEIEMLARRFANDAAAKAQRAVPVLSDAALAALRAHPWPGNVRELRNVMERAVLLADARIDIEHLPFESEQDAPSTTLTDELSALERTRILDALEKCDGNQTRAAAMLGMPRRTFVMRLDQYNISRPRKR